MAALCDHGRPHGAPLSRPSGTPPCRRASARRAGARPRGATRAAAARCGVRAAAARRPPPGRRSAAAPRPTGARRGIRRGRGSRGRGARSRSRRRSRRIAFRRALPPSRQRRRCRAARRRSPPRRGRRARAAGAAATGRSARHARSPSAMAFGTSTPTSITVVADQHRASAPPVKSAITAAFSAAGMRPCSRPTVRAGQRRAQLRVGVGRVLQVERLATPRSAGRPSRPAGPARDLVADARRSPRRAGCRRTRLVTTGVRPGGSSSIVLHVEVGEVASSPACAGSAWPTSSAGAARAPCVGAACCAARGAAPRRSGAARRRWPGRAARTRPSSWITACVPTTSCAVAVGDRCQHLRAASLPLRLPVSQATVDAERLEPADELAEVLLGEDLGRRHQRALPAGVDGDAPRRAPRPPSCREPTSPCSSRCIGTRRARRSARDLVDHALLRAR